MKNKLFVTVAFIVLFSALAHAAPPETVAVRTGCDMAMDGYLNEPAWDNAPSLAFVFPWYKDGDKEGTEAKILWDDERIYFAFSCADKHIAAHHYIHNDPVSRDDCCEAFICPVPSGSERLDYINYEINCLGTWKVGYHAKSRGKNLGDWTDVKHLEIGRVIRGTCNDDSDEDGGWTLEFSVPYEHFAEFGADFPPKDGQVIYLGLHRCGGDTNAQYSQWAPSQTDRPSYHQPQDFGKVTFSTSIMR